MDRKTMEQLLEACSLLENTAQNEGWDNIEAWAAEIREALDAMKTREES